MQLSVSVFSKGLGFILYTAEFLPFNKLFYTGINASTKMLVSLMANLKAVIIGSQ